MIAPELLRESESIYIVVGLLDKRRLSCVIVNFNWGNRRQALHLCLGQVRRFDIFSRIASELTIIEFLH